MSSGKHLVLLLAIAACGDFEARSIVLDLRPLAISASPPEIVVPATLEDFSFEDLSVVDLCALVADPDETRGLVWEMEVCPVSDSRRCDEDDMPKAFVGTGSIGDPEEPGTVLCTKLQPSGETLAVARAAFDADPIGAVAGVPIMVSLKVFPDGDEAAAIYAAKRVTLQPPIPDDRIANKNPSILSITGLRAPGVRGREFEVPLGRCGELPPFVVAAGETVAFLPVEGPDARETYETPTLDGDTVEVGEYMRYAWYASAGEWSREQSGGARDFAGNRPPTDSKWTAPDDAENLQVRFWIVQQDERGGLSWQESCAVVNPT